MLGWTSSYLAGRYQAVSIDGCLSRLRLVEHGVPQGSILGPLLYTLFTNELPETVYDHPQEHSRNQEDWPTFNMGCLDCGTVACYADDKNYSCADEDPDCLSQKLSIRYIGISDFLSVTNLNSMMIKPS